MKLFQSKADLVQLNHLEGEELHQGGSAASIDATKRGAREAVTHLSDVQQCGAQSRIRNEEICLEEALAVNHLGVAHYLAPAQEHLPQTELRKQRQLQVDKQKTKRSVCQLSC